MQTVSTVSASITVVLPRSRTQREPDHGYFPLGDHSLGSVFKLLVSNKIGAIQAIHALQFVDIGDMRKSFLLPVFLGSGIFGALIGMALVLLAGNDSWNRTTARWILWNASYPALRATDRLLGLFFTHERIAPGFTQLCLFNCLFVLFCGLALGLVCTTIAGALRFPCLSMVRKEARLWTRGIEH